VNKIKENPGNPWFLKLLAGAIIVILFSFLIFSYCNDDVKDARTLSLRAAKALENTVSYRFDMSSNISVFNEQLQVINLKGRVDQNNKKMYILINSKDRQMEAISIGDKTYARETNGSWQVREINEVGVWKDKLSEQHSIIENARNLTMYRQNGSYILEIVPEKEELMQQMRDSGIETSGIGLNKYVMRYWIEPGTYNIQKAETYADIDMNFRGIQTSIKLFNVIHLSGFNEKIKLEAPI